MDDRPDMRASDAERQDVVERLRAALDDGRLKPDEYVERMGRAYEAVTRGDLVPLCRDLPETTTPAPARPATPAAPLRPGAGAGAGSPRAVRPPAGRA